MNSMIRLTPEEKTAATALSQEFDAFIDKQRKSLYADPSVSLRGIITSLEQYMVRVVIPRERQDASETAAELYSM